MFSRGLLGLCVLAACKFPALVAHSDDQPGMDATDDAVLSDLGVDTPFVATTIQQVQDPSVPPGTPVMLTNVLVTAVDRYGARINDVYLQQPGGGAFSGVQVFGATPEQILDLDFRDIVSVTGVKTEFALSTDTTGRTVTEVVGSPEHPLTFVVAGTQGTVTIEYLDAAAIAGMSLAEQDAELAKWEGAYVQLSNVASTSTVTQVSGGDATFQQFTAPPYRIESALAMFPSGITTKTCFASIRGVTAYVYSYLLFPVGGGAVIGGTCP
jgi:predicted extracellular nuclease